jgi:hypothetical protein
MGCTVTAGRSAHSGRHGRTRRVPATVALLAFGLMSEWTLWGEGVEHVAVPSGFLLLTTGVAAITTVARWRAAREAEQFRSTCDAVLWTIWATSWAVVPASLVWMAAVPTSYVDGSPAPDFAPDLVLSGAGMLGSLAMLSLMWTDSARGSRDRRDSDARESEVDP